MRLAHGEQSEHAVAVSILEVLRYQASQRLSEHLGFGVAEYAFGTRIPSHDHAGSVGTDDGIVSALGHCLEVRQAGAQLIVRTLKFRRTFGNAPVQYRVRRYQGVFEQLALDRVLHGAHDGVCAGFPFDEVILRPILDGAATEIRVMRCCQHHQRQRRKALGNCACRIHSRAVRQAEIAQHDIERFGAEAVQCDGQALDPGDGELAQCVLGERRLQQVCITRIVFEQQYADRQFDHKLTCLAKSPH